MRKLTVRGTIDCDVAACDVLVHIANAIGRAPNTGIDARIRDYEGQRGWLTATPATARKLDSAGLYRLVLRDEMITAIRILSGQVRGLLTPEQEAELNEMSDVATAAAEQAVESRSMAKRIAIQKGQGPVV